MKHIFIVNPKAGSKKDSNASVVSAITTFMKKNGGDYEIYITKCPGDATIKTRRAAESGGEVRVYACGGDGTFNECLNGAIGHPNVALTSFPCGTGNDFVKQFGDEKELFTSVRALVNGTVRSIDAIKCNDRYAGNIVAVGFDARVGSDVHKYSRFKGMAGYVVSLIVNFFKGINQHMTIITPEKTYSGEFALICACNGRYYGGGFNPIPDAYPDDGIMDSLIVNKVSRFKFLALVKKYADGRYAELGSMVTRLRDGTITIECKDGLDVNLDGEAMKTDRLELTLIHHAVNMICPQGMKFFDDEEEKLSKSE